MQKSEQLEWRAQLLQQSVERLAAERRELAAERKCFALEQQIAELKLQLREREQAMDLLRQGHTAAELLPRPFVPAAQAEDERVALALVALEAEAGTWSGTMGELLQAIRPPSDPGRDWPVTAHKLTRCVKRAEPLLKDRGIEVDKVSKSRRGPIFRVRKLA